MSRFPSVPWQSDKKIVMKKRVTRKFALPRQTAVLALILMPVELVVGPAAEAVSHGEIVCDECHDLVASIDGGFKRTVVQGEKCADCHIHKSSSGIDDRLGFHGRENRDCVKCHSFHTTSVIKAGEVRFEYDFDDVNLSALCCACHDTSASPGALSYGHRLAAAAVYHRDHGDRINNSPSLACLSCHSQANLVGSIDLEGMSPPVFDERASHPYGIYVDPQRVQLSGFDRSLVLFDGKIECQTCHDLKSIMPDYLRFSGSYEDLCIPCHADHRRK